MRELTTPKIAAQIPAAQNLAAQDKGFFRRKFPRRAFSRLIGVLLNGNFDMFKAGEIGEGGMSIYGEVALPEGNHIVLSFQIPAGDFISIRAIIRSSKNEKGRFIHGLSFESIQFAHKRQIRVFVSSRSSDDELF